MSPFKDQTFEDWLSPDSPNGLIDILIGDLSLKTKSRICRQARKVILAHSPTEFDHQLAKTRNDYPIHVRARGVVFEVQDPTLLIWIAMLTPVLKAVDPYLETSYFTHSRLAHRVMHESDYHLLINNMVLGNYEEAEDLLKAYNILDHVSLGENGGWKPLFTHFHGQERIPIPAPDLGFWSTPITHEPPNHTYHTFSAQ